MSNAKTFCVLCTCRSYCTTYNAAKGTFEGPGFLLPVTTKWNHTQADKQQRREQKLRATEGRMSTATITNLTIANHHDNYTLVQIRDKVQWLSKIPFTPPRTLLRFVNDPAVHGDFNWPSDEVISIPNNGLYALSGDLRCNSTFLLTENHICELLSRIRRGRDLESQVAVEDVVDLIYKELSHLNRCKKVDWTQWRSQLENIGVVFNTGTALN